MRVNGWNARSWAILRLILGVYVAVHLGVLIPWGAELFSSAGLVPEAGASPLVRLFPNVLALWDGPVAVTLLLAVGAGAGLILAVGVADRPAAVVAWYVSTCLIGRNPLVLNPSLPHLGWTLLALALIPAAPSLLRVIRGREAEWRLPEPIVTAAWWVAGAAYTYSAWTKLGSASWRDGSALGYVLENPLARDTALRELALGLPGVLVALTFATVAIEACGLVAALLPRTRLAWWVATLAMHAGLLVFVDFADLTIGMIVTHLLLFDPAWIRRSTKPVPHPALRARGSPTSGLVRRAP